MRHRFLGLLLVLIGLFGLLGAIHAQDMTYSESPMLAERVANGELPPVEERLLVNPRVISLESSEIGTYGGDFDDPFVGDAFWSSQMVFWTFWKDLVNWNPTYDNWEPNIAESVEVSDDATTYTFHLREGIK